MLGTWLRHLSITLEQVLFWVLYFVVFVSAFIDFASQPDLAKFLTALAELTIPIALSSSAETAREVGRKMSAQLLMYLALVFVVIAELMILTRTPLSSLLNPQLLAGQPDMWKALKPELATSVVARIYSFFDVMTFIGTIATLGLVTLGILIPEETRRMHEQQNRRTERIKLAEQLLASMSSVHQSRPNEGDYNVLLGKWHTAWLALRNHITDANAAMRMDELYAEVRRLFERDGQVSGHHLVSKVELQHFFDLQNAVAEVARMGDQSR